MSFVLTVQLRVKRENVAAFMQHAIANGKAARETEPGCKTFDLLVDPQDPTRVMLYEVYVDEKAFEAHQQTAHFRKYLVEAVPLLASRERSVWSRAAP